MIATASSLARAQAPEPAPIPWTAPRRRDVAAGRGWDVYLALSALLVPMLQPSIPGAQAALVDLVNAAAIAVFACIVLARRPALDLPLIAPVLVISIGSLIAVTNAESFGKAVLTMVQDAYLYVWFLFLVSVLRVRGDARALRLAWMWGANIAAAIALFLLLTDGTTTIFKIFGAKGWRAVGLFDGPNSLADYLMLSWFVTLSLWGQANRLMVGGSLGLVFLTLVATKSNGSMSSWVLGMAVWAVVRLLTRTGSMLATAATSMLLVGALLFGWWVTTEWGVGGQRLESVLQSSFLGRLENSAEGREQIWGRLLERYRKTPLGIGPGNSSEQRLTVGSRERRGSQRSKEAHNDYLGYLVERGPLGLLGLAMLVVLPFVAVWRGFRKVADRHWRRGPGGGVAAALAGGLIATTFHSLTMEKLHFRHYWMFLAIVYAFALASGPGLLAAMKRRRGSRRRSSRTTAPASHQGHLRPETA